MSTEMISPQAPSSGPVQQLRAAFDSAGYQSALTLCAYLAAGALLALYVRLLYRRTSRNPSADSVARVFPLLTVVTIAVISVVKSSLSLSLGLVGALSIVRFRAAIKDPEELVYLFLCIGLGLALGAEQPLIAIALVVVASVMVLVVERVGGVRGGEDAYVTVIGPARRFVGGGDDTALAVIERACRAARVQRCDVDGEEGQLRVQLRAEVGVDAQQLLSALREGLPDCQISYVNAEQLA